MSDLENKSINQVKKNAIQKSKKFVEYYNSELFRLQFNKLKISKKYYREYFLNNELIAIQLRKINHDLKKLVIGCGNQPTSKIYQNTEETKNLIRKKYSNEHQISSIIDRLENEDHSHEDAVTIDIDITMNPTIVANFGKNTLSCLRSNNYDIIIFEGISRKYLSENNKEFNSEIERLLSRKGKIIDS